tara:strand:+ start:50 stop:229 length:180 start_codon:yes stop_codon:yes gene_type:complete
MKVGDLFMDGDGRMGVVVVVLESIEDKKGAKQHASIGYFFESKQEIIVFKSEVYIIGEE